VKLSDVERKPPDILSDLSETEVYCLFDPSVLVSSFVKQNVPKQVNFGFEVSMNDTFYLRIIYPGLKFYEALMESNLKTLIDRRDDMCVQLIKDMSNPNHKLNHLLPKKTSQIKQLETRRMRQRTITLHVKQNVLNMVQLYMQLANIIFILISKHEGLYIIVSITNII
jgi:hypothetical protein